MNARLPLLATFGAGAFLLAGESHNGTLVLVRLTICGATLAAVSAIDIAEQRVPNRLVLPAALACAGLSLAAGVSTDGLLTGAALVVILVSLARPRALGMGDVKLALLIVVGLDGSAVRSLLLGLFLATLAGLATIARDGTSARHRALPLAPFIATGSLLALLT